MNVIIEGPDNSGKSTLARAISERINWPIWEKEGKPPTFEDTVKKIERYLREIPQEGIIIDRHPIVSQMVYGSTVRKDPQVPRELMREFSAQRHLIIYARCIHLGLQGHKASPTDTPEHLEQLREKYVKILTAYDFWALRCAHIIYNNWRQVPLIVRMCEGALP
jgi:thymidylate kinase